jgi:hypothetical protein
MTVLSEEYVQDSFHTYLKLSLAQAKAERLLDADVLSSAEADLMITGPALSLYFAALRSTTTPPSVPLPSPSPAPLSSSTCPPAFLPFFTLWASTVPAIQSLAPTHQHDLARIICSLPPLSAPRNPALNAIAADLRAVAIDISQRRSFQDRYAGDLQAAIDAGAGPSGHKLKASFVPPPSYDSPSSHADLLSPTSPHGTHRPPTPRRTPSPTFLAPTSPAIELIRETLYASLADVLATHPTLRALLTTDPPRAYFAAVAVAILDVAATAVTPSGSVVGVLGKELVPAACPPELRPFMAELAAIGRLAREAEDEDNESAMRWAEGGMGELAPQPVMERVRRALEEGVVGAREGERRSVDGRAVGFANRVNALSLGLTRLKAFRERQQEVFDVLKGVAGD